MVIYYFGYGSNLSSAMMQDWCPDYQLIGTGKLIDWELVFTRFSERWGAGVADIIQQDNSVVWGGLYQISEADLVSLDIKESNGQHYQRISCDVIVDSVSYKAFTYVVIDKSNEPIPTSNAYKNTMFTGARELNFPEDYIEKIANLPING